jgi:hypothetical protein
MGPLRDITMYHLDICQIEDSGCSLHQINPTSGAIEKVKLGIRHHHRQRDPGKTDPGAHVENLGRWLRKAGGEQQRVADMTVVDAIHLVGTKTTGCHCLGEQPLPIGLEETGLLRGETGPGPRGASGPDLWFHVKQCTEIDSAMPGLLGDAALEFLLLPRKRGER